jgi:tRNA A37 N6-isopentenylltransferase MiaA
MSNEQVDAILDKIDRHFEIDLMRRVPDALLNDGDQIYIRKVDGRLQWIKANVHGGGQEWEELTPRISRQIEAMAVEDAQDEIEAEARAKRVEELEKLKAIKVGWYQDTKGDLYQFDGTTWLGTTPSIGQIEKLEYLGK